MAVREREILERAIRTVSEQAAAASAIVDEGLDAGLDGSHPLTVHAKKMLRLELLNVKADLERELGTLVLDCSKCGRTVHWSPVSESPSATARGELVAVDDLTFSLEAGTITGFLGPNGAGKTTTLRLLLGLAEPTAGEALVFGRRYRELNDPARLVGAVLESSDFHPGRSGPTTCARSRSRRRSRRAASRRCWRLSSSMPVPIGG